MSHLLKSLLSSLCLIGLLTSCADKFPSFHSPQDNLPKSQLEQYILAYCWENPDGRKSHARPQNTEVAIVISSGDGEKRVEIRNKMNLPDQKLSDFVIFKNGCVADDNYRYLRYAGFALSWRPHTDELTFLEGSSPSLTRIDGVNLTDAFDVNNGSIYNFLKGHERYFLIPRGIYWSPDSKKVATLGRDINIPNSGGDNIWVYDSNNNSYTRITNFNQAGNFIANASWSRNGNVLAIEYEDKNGIGIARTGGTSEGNSYLEVTSETHKELSSNWPCTGQSLMQLLLKLECVEFNSYISRNSIPVWVNDDAQVVFTAVKDSGEATLFTISSNGENLKPLLPELSGIIFMPRLSPDNKTLTFVRYPDWKNINKVEIGTMDITTRDISSLAVLSAFDGNDDLIISGMDWSPDGKYLAFSSNHSGESDIYIATADGRSWLNLTENIDGNAVSPVWKP